jgi:hypothetical protein
MALPKHPLKIQSPKPVARNIDHRGQIFFVALYENEFVPELVFSSPVKNVPFPIPVLGEITRPDQEI